MEKHNLEIFGYLFLGIFILVLIFLPIIYKNLFLDRKFANFQENILNKYFWNTSLITISFNVKRIKMIFLKKAIYGIIVNYLTIFFIGLFVYFLFSLMMFELIFFSWIHVLLFVIFYIISILSSIMITYSWIKKNKQGEIGEEDAVRKFLNFKKEILDSSNHQLISINASNVNQLRNKRLLLNQKKWEKNLKRIKLKANNNWEYELQLLYYFNDYLIKNDIFIHSFEPYLNENNFFIINGKKTNDLFDVYWAILYNFLVFDQELKK